MDYPKVSTSAYWHPEVIERCNSGVAVPVGITLYPLRKDYGYGIPDRVMGLAPSRSIFKKGLSREDYTKAFWNLLMQKWYRTQEELLKISKNNFGKELILLCFEDVVNGGDDVFCHRTLVADFIEKRWNIKIEEIPFQKKEETNFQMALC